MKCLLLKSLVAAVALLATTSCVSAASTRSTTATLASERGAPTELVSSLQRGERVTLADIEVLAALQVPDDTMLAYLRDSGAAYELTVVQIDQLRAAGVSARVIDYLLKTPAQVARRNQRSRAWYGFGYPHHGGGHHYHGGGHHGGHH